MLKKIVNIFCLTSFFLFIFLIAKYYFSDQNIKLTNKTRSSYLIIMGNNKQDLPILKNDTNNVIIYKDDLEEFKSKRKKRFWEKLISN